MSSIAYPCSRIARSSATALAGVSRPTALPMRACLVGYAENTSANPLLCGRDRAQPRVPYRKPGDAGAALRIGDIGDQPLVVNLLERERDCDDATVELGNGDLGGDVERRHSVVVVLPLRPRTGQAQALQDRDVQRGQMRHVPGVVIATGGDGGRRRPRPRPARWSPSRRRCRAARAGSASAVRNDAQNTGSARPPASSIAAHSAST